MVINSLKKVASFLCAYLAFLCDISFAADSFSDMFWSPDPLGSFTYYIFWVFWYLLCFNVAAIAYQEYPAQSKMTATCMEGVHMELIHAFSIDYKPGIITP